ncbi:MAG: aspartate ammonia-lyase, partial [Bacteroidetes bacterium]|nr:aspartate ammonia-lyase [Bacteroidota bacterium]
MHTRKETDLLGDIELPSDLYYGIHTQRAVDNFQVAGRAVGNYRLFIKGLVLTKKACAYANKEIGTIPDEKADMIIQACDEVLQEKHLEHYAAYFPTDVFQGGAGTSVNMN